MEFTFLGEDIILAIEQEIIRLKEKVEELNIKNKELKNNYEKRCREIDEFNAERDKMIEENERKYVCLPIWKKIFMNKRKFVMDSVPTWKYKPIEYNCGYGLDVNKIKNKIWELEKEKCLFDKDIEYVLGLEECKRYGLDSYMCGRE